MTDHPYADIRRALVEGIRNSDKPAKLKAAAEVWIAVIDNIEKYGSQDHTELAFQVAHQRFLDAAKETSFPDTLSPAEIAKAFGLGPRHQ